MIGFLERVEQALRQLGEFTSEVAGWGYLLGAVFITVNVFSRRFLGFSSPGVVEISGYLLAIGISFGLVHTLATKGHIRVDVLVRQLPPQIRVYMHTLALAFLTGFAILLAARGWSVLEESWRLEARDTTALELSLVLPQSLWVFGLAAFATLGMIVLLRTILLLTRGHTAEVESLLGPVAEEEEAVALVTELLEEQRSAATPR
jgi:TRAP-type C4-dicarboxylate transport system permease small subunit